MQRLTSSSGSATLPGSPSLKPVIRQTLASPPRDNPQALFLPCGTDFRAAAHVPA
jgi:hypothetical protein